MEDLALWPQGPKTHAWVGAIHLGCYIVLTIDLIVLLLVLEPGLR